MMNFSQEIIGLLVLIIGILGWRSNRQSKKLRDHEIKKAKDAAESYEIRRGIDYDLQQSDDLVSRARKSGVVRRD